jgi:hypothetical protein
VRGVARLLVGSEGEALASCNGYLVEASDGPVGEVETPLFPPDRLHPDYLVLRVVGVVRVRRPVLATALVEEVDSRRRLVRVGATKRQIESLPEHLPLAI